jgi:peptidoglycan/xylan/chitin deacetylase (PgdA/CDA1 family)
VFTLTELPATAASTVQPEARRWSPTPLIRAAIAVDAAGLCALLLDPSHWRWYLGAVLANHLLIGAAGMAPRSRLIDRNLVRLPEAAARRGELSLTFDDGPDPELTPQVLDLLERHGARASFFVVAERAAAHPDLVREIVRRGHSVENHSYRHAYTFANNGLGGYRREVGAAQALIAGLTGQPPRFFRAPMGLRSPLLDPVLAKAGLCYVSWTRRGLDTLGGDPGRVLARLTRGLAAGDILLMHDRRGARAPDGRPMVLAVLPALLERIAERGLRSVSLPVGCS